MKKTAAFILTMLLLMILSTPTHADVAPPNPPPGSNINPSQDTKVQMVAENVLMVVKEVSTDVYVIEVTADFAMKNLGETDEQMRVRFPLENAMGWGGDNYPVARYFKASVNQTSVPTEFVTETYLDDSFSPADWAVFDVNFPVGQVVNIRVSYTTDLQDGFGVGDPDSFTEIQYFLGTGAGWYQSIGTVAITLRLPYTVCPATIDAYWPDHDNAHISEIGHEIRWHWQNYEPNPREIIGVTIIHPNYWREILDMEARIGIDPGNVDLAIELSNKYKRASFTKLGNPPGQLSHLAEITIQQALVLHPDDIRLHLELLEMYYDWYLWDYYYMSDDTSLENSKQLLNYEMGVVLALDPTNQRIHEIQAEIANAKEEDRWSVLYPTPSATPLVCPSATPTRTIVAKTPTPKPSETPVPMITPTGTPEVSQKSNPIGGQVLAGVVMLVLGFIAGVVFMKNRARPV